MQKESSNAPPAYLIFQGEQNNEVNDEKSTENDQIHDLLYFLYIVIPINDWDRHLLL